ncbi:TPA: hypothetical protein ACOJBC_004238 [Escherichia coli]|uniref:hypothetical protein n=1 Tax=Escherichia TaxID=561 RepID=UPI0002B9D3A5|nr:MULTISPECIES: hypothetical protein [Escherichia]EFE0636800.1 hypothetical protein [Escherichia coli]EFO0116793.1 hypothetical protein [Escherichia coli]EFO0120673.1 hypothetical protein [Escherichia coli]EFO0130901.1 hypothetical protein [Escherichia coli]EJV7177023.1 hypothetical protein [Escherichia coli]
MTAAKEQIEYELNEFFASALGDVFKSCRLAESVSDYQISTVSFPTEKNAWLELGELPVIIELSNGRRFEISASEWLQITPL